MTKPTEDFCNALVEEFLSETADHFFGTRKQLETMIREFHRLVAELRQKQADVAERAGFLNFLLLRGNAADRFYSAVRTDPDAFGREIRFSEKALPPKMPFSLTDTGKFILFVLGAYNALQQECCDYMNGKFFYDPDDSGRENVTVHYHQIRIMCDLINEKIHKINTEMSPVCVLQYARKFDPAAEARERITGGGTGFDGYACSIDEKLAYKPIDFDSLQLKSYPELPDPEQIKVTIKKFCRKLYSDHKDEIRSIMAELARKIA